MTRRILTQVTTSDPAASECPPGDLKEGDRERKPD